MIATVHMMMSRWLIVPVAINIVGIAAALWALFGPFTPAYVVTYPDKHTVVVRCGEMDVIRFFTVTRPVTLTINRDLLAPNGVQVHRRDLPNTQAFYAPGQYRIVRSIPLPEYLPAGRYEARFTVEYEVNALRRHTVNLPPFAFEYDPIALGCQ